MASPSSLHPSSWLLCFAAACGSHTTAPPAATAPPSPVITPATATTFAQAGAPAALIAASSGATLLADDGPPISLTASDGTGLVLTRLEARAVVEGPLAFTELHLTFRNPLDRVLEGRFAITLPDGAALSRFAMAQDRGWMEAEVVERMAARRAYEDFLHRKQDPALLENEAGNEFSARVFPIAARGEKQLIVSFSHEVRGTYTLPLRGLPQVGHVAAEVLVARPDRAGPAFDATTFTRDAWTPDRDVSVALTGTPSAIRSGDVVAIAVDPLADARPAPLTGATILFDTSASRALGYHAQVENLMGLVAELARVHGATTPITLAAFDQSVEEIYRGPASGFAVARDRLLARRALGASDLAGALGWAAARGGTRRVVLISDAVATVGDEAAVTTALTALKAKADRLDVVLVGGIRDRAAAARLSRGTLAQDGAVLDSARGPAEVARRLGLATRSGLKVQIDGARWVWPAVLDGVQPGDTAVVLAQLTGPAVTSARLTVRAGDVVSTVAPSTVARPLVARAAAGAEIARLTAERLASTDAARRTALATQIVALSTRTRVLSDLTALLVLETEADYARFGIPRTALTDIMVVGAKGLDVQRRAGAVLMAAPEAPAKKPRPEPSADKDVAKIAGDDLAMALGGSATMDLEQEDAAEGDRNDQPIERRIEARHQGAPGAVGTAAAPPPPPAATRMAEERSVARRAAPRPSPARRFERVHGTAAGSQGDGATGGALAADGPAPEPVAKSKGVPPLEGELAAVMALVARGAHDQALAQALAWRARDPGDVLALVALGEVLEAKAMPALAARAYGSIIDLFPSRADLRRFAGERLERLGATGRALAVDTYRQAVASRPDHLTSHRLLAWALVRSGDLAGALAALEVGLAQSYPGDRFRGGARILAEDLGVVASAWIAREPARRAEIERRVKQAGGTVAHDASLRFVLYWETDANDVDFHIHDARGGHAFYQNKALASGGELYEDVTTGYGPENFTIRGKPAAYPYQLQIHYYSRGPMGYGMGLLQIVRHDGKGGLAFEDRPYIVMVDGAFVDLGTVDAKTAALGPTLAR